VCALLAVRSVLLHANRVFKMTEMDENALLGEDLGSDRLYTGDIIDEDELLGLNDNTVGFCKFLTYIPGFFRAKPQRMEPS
jgi:hypothetical protein